MIDDHDSKKSYKFFFHSAKTTAIFGNDSQKGSLGTYTAPVDMIKISTKIPMPKKDIIPLNTFLFEVTRALDSRLRLNASCILYIAVLKSRML